MSLPQPKLDHDDQESPRESKYQFISYQLRKSLVDMVFRSGFSVYRAAKVLGINQSTAKAIARKYRAKGTIFKRKCQENEESTFLLHQPKPVEQKEHKTLQQPLQMQGNRGQSLMSCLPVQPWTSFPTYYFMMPMGHGFPSGVPCLPFPFPGWPN